MAKNDRFSNKVTGECGFDMPSSNKSFEAPNQDVSMDQLKSGNTGVKKMSVDRDDPFNNIPCDPDRC